MGVIAPFYLDNFAVPRHVVQSLVNIITAHACRSRDFGRRHKLGCLQQRRKNLPPCVRTLDVSGVAQDGPSAGFGVERDRVLLLFDVPATKVEGRPLLAAGQDHRRVGAAGQAQ